MLSLIVCDQIITDRVTGKVSLIGMFATVHTPRFPWMRPQTCVYAALTDGHGKTPIIIRMEMGKWETVTYMTRGGTDPGLA